jgi:hypothetical protein
MLYPTVLRYSTVFQPIVTVYAYIVKVSHDHVLLLRRCNNLMHMWHHVTNHLIISNDKDSNSENRIKLCVRDNTGVLRGELRHQQIPQDTAVRDVHHRRCVFKFVQCVRHGKCRELTESRGLTIFSPCACISASPIQEPVGPNDDIGL